MKAPHIRWQAGLNGHGILQGRLKGALNSTRSLHLDPATYKLPSTLLSKFPFLRLLTKFEKTRWQHGLRYIYNILILYDIDIMKYP